MDNLILSSQSLQRAADMLEKYAERQKSVVDTFLYNIKNLSYEWQDDDTFYSMFEEIVRLQNKIYAKMDTVKAYANIFRMRAHEIEQRLHYIKDGLSMGGFSTPSVSVSGNGSIASIRQNYEPSTSMSTNQSKVDGKSYEEIDLTGLCMKQNPFDEKVLEEDIRRIDRASEEIWSFYTTLKKEDISNLMQYEFICPKTGKRIKPQRIAYRGKGNIKPNGANVCGADFYYDDNTFCCSYEGTTWKEIYECNYSDTIRFRDKTNENKK